MSTAADTGRPDRVPRRRSDHRPPHRPTIWGTHGATAGGTGPRHDGSSSSASPACSATPCCANSARIRSSTSTVSPGASTTGPDGSRHLRDRIVPAVDVTRFDHVRRLVDELRPDVVVNCVGVIKQRPDVQDAVPTVTLNALFPHLLADACAQVGGRLVHVSTDCVFSGRRGGYVEDDLPDPPDLYGRSKLLGEATGVAALTLRTSIVGHELATNRPWWTGSSPNAVRYAVSPGPSTAG